MVTLITKPGLVEALLVDDILRTPDGDWSELPDWLHELHQCDKLIIRPNKVSMLEFKDASGALKWLSAQDWLVRDPEGRVFGVSAEAFEGRFYPRDDAPPAPFAPGDVVSLTSGGFAMTVEECRRSCAPGGFLVDVVWGGDARQSELARETLPAVCLIGSTARNDDNIPF